MTRLVIEYEPRIDWDIKSEWLEATAASEHKLSGVTELVFRDREVVGSSLVALAASPHLGALELLDLSYFQSDGDAIAEAIASNPSITRLTHLELGWNVGNAGLKALAASDKLKKLKTFRLTHGDFTKVGLTALFRAELNTLERLTLDGHELSAASVEALAKATTLKKVRHLTIRLRERDGARALEALAKSDVLTRLESLSITRGALSREAALALFCSDNVKRLKRLEFVGVSFAPDSFLIFGSERCQIQKLEHLRAPSCGLRDDDLAQLAAGSACLSTLKSLDLSENVIGDSGVAALQGAFPALRSLDLSENQVGSSGALVLADKKCLPKLKSLDLSFNAVRALGADALGKRERLKVELSGNPVSEGLGVDELLALPNLRAMTSIEFKGDPIGDAGVEKLVVSSAIAHIKGLKLDGCGITDVGAQAIASSKNLKKLKWLELPRNAIGDEGAVAIARSTNLKKVELIDLSHNAIVQDGACAFCGHDDLSLYLSGNPLNGVAYSELHHNFHGYCDEVEG